ncbi:MAG: hypothetical protein HGA85_00475 [Nanoarchaeota archaeon]|nr:hypothetical protein [Nanoarchaeota archaeon]
MRKAQTELLGVAIIVVILVMGGLFMVAGSLNKKESVTPSIIDQELAQSFLNTLMSTDTDTNVDVMTLVKDGCYQDRKELCNQAPNCCVYVRQIMENSLESTLKAIGRKYQLNVSSSIGPKIDSIPTGKVCTKYMRSSQVTYSIPSVPQILVTLTIC